MAIESGAPVLYPQTRSGNLEGTGRGTSGEVGFMSSTDLTDSTAPTLIASNQRLAMYDVAQYLENGDDSITVDATDGITIGTSDTWNAGDFSGLTWERASQTQFKIGPARDVTGRKTYDITAIYDEDVDSLAQIRLGVSSDTSLVEGFDMLAWDSSGTRKTQMTLNSETIRICAQTDGINLRIPASQSFQDAEPAGLNENDIWIDNDGYLRVKAPWWA